MIPGVTIFVQLIRPARRPGRSQRAPYWTAWMDPAGNGSGVGRTKAEAIGELMLLLAEKELGEVEIRTQPTVDYREPKNGGV